MEQDNNEPASVIRNKILNIVRQIRANTPYCAVNTMEAKGSEVWEASLEGVPAKRVIIYLRSSGCSWVIGSEKDNNGNNILQAGCINCTHSLLGTTFGRSIPAENYIAQFDNEYEKHKSKSFPILCLYNEGSFFNENELPINARNALLEKIGKFSHIKTVILESLPQWVTDNALEELTVYLENKNVEIGIGLDAITPEVRDLCVNKPFRAC